MGLGKTTTELENGKELIEVGHIWKIKRNQPWRLVRHSEGGETQKLSSQ